MDQPSGFYTHQIYPGRTGRTEVVVVFNFIQVEELHPQYTNAERRKEIIEKLTARANQMKIERGQ
jgi:hypothetical protein